MAIRISFYGKFIYTFIFLFITNIGEFKAENEIYNRPIGTNLNTKLPESKTGFTKSGNVNIWYEIFNPAVEPKGTILLIMGMSGDAMEWPDEFINSFLTAGYRVIRYDHRDVGLSDWTKKYYSLEDLTTDAIAVLDANNVVNAHVIGLSMGGMIAQKLALNYPNRINSLTLMMSTIGYSIIHFNNNSYMTMMRLFLNDMRYKFSRTERSRVKRQLTVKQILNVNSGHTPDYEKIYQKVLFNIKFRKGYNLAAGQKHLFAVLSSDLKWKDCANITQPVLIIHGEKDPFIPVECGKKLHLSIKNSQALFLAEMGHDLSEPYISIITGKIINFYRENKSNLSTKIVSD